MATETVFPPFLDTGDPVFHDPVLAQLMGDTTQDDLLTDLLGDDLLSSLLTTSQPPQTYPQASPVLPEAMDPTLLPVHPSPLPSDGYSTDASPLHKAQSPASLASEYLGDSVLALDGHIMEPTVSTTTAPSPASSNSSDIRIDVDLESCGMKGELKAATLVLTEEEKRLLAEEGVMLPTDMPLTKAEQKHLKRVRRKVKNKVSAQESRKRKKEYVDGLEHRVEKCTRINQQLQNKVHVLESENNSLLSQLKKLQALVAGHYPTRLQAGAVVMVVALSFSLFFVPQFRPGSSPGSNYHTVTVPSRSLLFMETDEFGNIFDRESGKVISEAGGLSPVPPPPWTYQTPAFNLPLHNFSLSRHFRLAY